MKSTRFFPLLSACSLLAFSTAGCAEKAKDMEPTLPVVKPVAVASPATPAADAPAAKAAPWSELKGCTYDQRELFLSGLKGLAGRVDAQITELVTKRASMDANNTSTKDWDFAMKEMGNARTTLISTSSDMAQATRDTWDQQKDKVGLAWVHTQDAYAKVNASTTR